MHVGLRASAVSGCVSVLLLSGAIWTTPALAQSPQARRATIVDLGVPGGFATSSANGLNQRGEVAGSISAGPGPTDSHAAVWRHGAWHDLGEGSAATITLTGRAVGFAGAMASQHAATWSQSGQVSSMPNLANGFWSQALYANGIGQVVGYAQSTTTRAVIWNQGNAHELAARGTGASYAFGINELGQVVGSDAGEAVMWDRAGRESVLGAGPSSIAYAINTRADVVGAANGHAFTWTKGSSVQLLPVPNGVGTTNAVAVNEAGDAVGSAQVPSGGLPTFHAVLWHNHRMCDLNSVLPSGSGWELATATGVNDHGQIVGNGSHDGQDRPFLLTLAGSAC